jgi:hypothetical protein
MNNFIKNYITESPRTSADSMKSIDFTYSSDNEPSQLKQYIILYEKYMEDLDDNIKEIIERLLVMDFDPKKDNEFLRKNLTNSLQILKQRKLDYEEMNELILYDPDNYKKTMENFIKNYQNI